MQPRIENLSEKKLVGKQRKMSLARNETFSLWQSFMPFRNEITNKVGPDLFSVEVYDEFYFGEFNPQNTFQKWAAVEVTNFDHLPSDMEALVIPEGLYAVFVHKGPASEGPKTYGYIFGTWLPNSTYVLDNRPHFALMGAKYKNNDPDSEEELWVPVRERN